MTKNGNALDPRDRLHDIDSMSEAEKSYSSMAARDAADHIWNRHGGRAEFIKLIAIYLKERADEKIKARMTAEKGSAR